jgi:hypothetical protein
MNDLVTVDVHNPIGVVFVCLFVFITHLSMVNLISYFYIDLCSDPVRNGF